MVAISPLAVDQTGLATILKALARLPTSPPDEVTVTLKGSFVASILGVTLAVIWVEELIVTVGDVNSVLSFPINFTMSPVEKF